MSVKPTRRERQRAATVDEIKEVARSLMRQHGPADLRFTAIAKHTGMTAPALYNYFAGREALIAALTADAYRELAAEVVSAGESCADDDVGVRWLAMGTAYRNWARREPEQFGLVFAPQVRRQEHRDIPTGESADDVSECAASTFPGWGDLFPAACPEAMVQAWATVHGFTCLDVYSQLDWMSDRAREQLFSATLHAAAVAAGVPAQNASPVSP
jgi:AcrR family transcriptional regulator